MSNIVKIKRGSGTPTTSDLAQYELAYDYTNDKLYIHDPTNSSGNEIVEVGGGGASTSGSNNQLLTDDGSGGITSESELTYSAGTLKLEKASGNAVFRIQSNDSNPRIYFNEGNTTKANLGYSIQNNRFELYNGNTPFSIEDGAGSNTLVVDSNSRVGVGTTTPAFSYATKGIEVQASGENPAIRLDRGGSILEIAARSSDILFYNTGTAQTMRFGIAGTERLRIGATGVVVNEVGESKDFRVEGDTDQNLFFVDGSADRVGIGTNSPQQKLNIQDGELVFTHSSLNQASSGTIRFNEYASNSTAVAGSYIRYNGSSNSFHMYLNNESTDYEFLRATRNSHLVLQSGGNNVGIGETSPDTKLHIKTTGSGSTSLLKLEDNARLMFLGRDSIAVKDLSNNAAQLYINSNTTFSGNITTGGVFTSGGNIVTPNTATITAGYGVAFTNGNPNFLQYNNGGENVLYLRDTTNGAMLLTYGTTRTTIHKNTRHMDQVEFEDTTAVINRVSNDLEIRTYAGYDINLMPSGNLGVGTTSPLGHLDINTESAETTSVYINGEANEDKLLLIRHHSNSEAAGALQYAGFIGSVVDNVLTLGHYDNTGNETQVLHITEVGRVGIGTQTPSKALEVIGDIRIKQGANYGNYSNIDATEARLTLETYSINTSNHPADIIFKPAGTERMRIGDDGVVDISGSLILDTALAIAEGGTGATNNHNARINLGLGTLAELNQVTAATIADNNVGADELDVSGDGTNGQYLASDGAGGFNWISPVSSTNAGTLDNLDSTQFLRSDTSDTAAGNITFTGKLLGNTSTTAILNGGSFTNLNTAFSNDIGTSKAAGLQPFRYSNNSSNTPLGGSGSMQNNANWGLSLYSHGTGGNGNYGLQMSGGDNDNQLFFIRRVTNGSFGSWFEMWHSGNDGSGSGLDADNLDGTTWTATDKTVRWDNGRGYHGNPRSMAIGYSGQNYGQFGYNINFTTTSGQHTAAFTDIATRVDLHDGLRVYSSVSNATGGGNISWTEYLRVQNSNFLYKGNKIWHAGNDGGGSNLDADKLDGIEASQFLRNDAVTETITSQNWNNFIDGTEVHFSSVTNHSGSNRPSGAYTYGVALSYSVNSGGKFQLYAPETASNGTATNQGLWYRTGWNTTYRQWAQIWDSTNDGSGSGLNADLVDGLQASSFLRSDANDTATGSLTLAAQTWNGNITWNNGKNIFVAGESSFDVSGSGIWQVWDSGTGAPFIKCDVGQRVEIGQAGSRGLKVHGDFDPTGTHYVRHGGSDYSPNISFLGGTNTPGSTTY